MHSRVQPSLLGQDSRGGKTEHERTAEIEPTVPGLPKCVFMAPSVIYFGLRFSERGIQPTDEKVKAIRDAPTPSNVTELRSFLGMLAAVCNFKLSTLAHPLYKLLGNKPWNWPSSCEQAFRDVKHALRSDFMI